MKCQEMVMLKTTFSASLIKFLNRLDPETYMKTDGIVDKITLHLAG